MKIRTHNLVGRRTEHQTMAFIGGFSFGLISHEMAHQWFGDKVTCGSWHDIFLMKALPPPGGFMP